MSKLLEKLRRVRTIEARAMGFGAAAKASQPSMLVIARVQPAEAKRAFDAGADFVLVPAEEGDPKRIVQTAAADGKPVGLEWPAPDLAGLKASGADFVVFEIARAAAAVLRAEGMDRIPFVEPSLEDSSLRALDALNVDAILLRSSESELLTVMDVLRYQRVAAFVRVPVLIELAAVPDVETLATLRDGGFDGIVVDGSQVARSRETVNALPPRAKRQRSRTEAIVPHVGLSHGEPEEDEEED